MSIPVLREGTNNITGKCLHCMLTLKYCNYFTSSANLLYRYTLRMSLFKIVTLVLHLFQWCGYYPNIRPQSPLGPTDPANKPVGKPALPLYNSGFTITDIRVYFSGHNCLHTSFTATHCALNWLWSLKNLFLWLKKSENYPENRILGPSFCNLTSK